MTYPTTLLGFNQTHLVNQVTDSKCRIIPEKVDKLKTIPTLFRSVMRWPGGSIAGDYHLGQLGHSSAEAKNSKWKRNNIDPMYVFIELSRMMKWKVLIVLNVEDIYYKNLEGKYQEAEASMDRNVKMVSIFRSLNIPIAGVEIGNEIQIYTKVQGEYNRNPKAFNEAIDKYFAITETLHMMIKQLDPDIKTGACYVTPNAAAANNRDLRWWDVFKDTSCDALIVHHYEEDTDEKNWLPKLQRMSDSIHNLGKEAWFTEGMWNFGPGTNHPKFAASMRATQTWQKYKDSWFLMVQEAGFDIATMHRISGNDGHPYDFVEL